MLAGDDLAGQSVVEAERVVGVAGDQRRLLTRTGEIVVDTGDTQPIEAAARVMTAAGWSRKANPHRWAVAGC